MSLFKRPLTSTQKKSLITLGIAVAIGASFLGGMALNRVLDNEYRTPFMLEKLYMDAQEDLIERSKIVFRDDGLARLSFISGLRQAGVAAAYNVEIHILRMNAFEASSETKDVAAIQAVDTRMADRLLLDAIPRLGDDDLYRVLKENSDIFLSEDRAPMLSDTDSTENGLRYHNLYLSHSTLSEQEREQLTACFKKLEEKLGKQEDKVLMFENGSGACMPAVEPKKVDLFSPRRFLKYQ
jgi:hypothetical protein